MKVASINLLEYRLDNIAMLDYMYGKFNKSILMDKIL